MEQTNEINRKIRQKLLEEGEFYIVQTKLNNQVYLRTTIMNPMTQIKDFENLLDRLSSFAL